MYTILIQVYAGHFKEICTIGGISSITKKRHKSISLSPIFFKKGFTMQKENLGEFIATFLLFGSFFMMTFTRFIGG